MTTQPEKAVTSSGLRRFIHDAGGRKFLLAVLVVILAFVMSMFGPDSEVIVTKWNDMALIVVGFYFGYKAAEIKPPSSPGGPSK